MVPLGIEEQMSLPLLASGRRCRSFVVAQAGQDFTCNDLAFAQRVQPTLLGLARQVSAVRRWESLFSQAQSRRVAGEELAETRLTGSELAVLQLLGQGLTATTIANRLGVMPRTVHKHLQHVYAKLHTSDRLTAVIIARRLGILTEQES
jgi:DNA-binding NarL/FixJ family response regulator